MDTRLTAPRKENDLGTDVAQQIEELAQMTVSQLREKYIEVFGEESRSNHKQFLFRRIAFRFVRLFRIHARGTKGPQKPERSQSNTGAKKANKANKADP